MNKLILFFIIFFPIIFAIVTKDTIGYEVKILKKINNEIITNIDVDDEYNYLLALNSNLQDIDKNTAKKIAEDSLVREKIKLSEIKKFVDVEKFANDKSIDKVIREIILGLNLENIEQFSNYLSSYNLDIDRVRSKISVEILWNQLISARYEKKIILDKKKFLIKLRTLFLNKKKLKSMNYLRLFSRHRTRKISCFKVTKFKKVYHQLVSKILLANLVFQIQQNLVVQ